MRPPTPLIAADIADADLILEDQEESADHVAHERLRAEAHREPDDAGAGEERRDVDVELFERWSGPQCPR